jgi:polynucleotide 5'-kinase involved in rRNA processing
LTFFRQDWLVDLCFYLIFGVDGTVPLEILARGPNAFKAYQEALKSGKTKNRRLLVAVVGPARAGKTSLLRTLKGEILL